MHPGSYSLLCNPQSLSRPTPPPAKRTRHRNRARALPAHALRRRYHRLSAGNATHTLCARYPAPLGRPLRLRCPQHGSRHAGLQNAHKSAELPPASGSDQPHQLAAPILALPVLPKPGCAQSCGACSPSLRGSPTTASMHDEQANLNAPLRRVWRALFLPGVRPVPVQRSQGHL